MNFNDFPNNKIPIAWAVSGLKNTIPATSGTLPNSATWNDGFPSITMQPYPPAGNGQPPLGADMNGVLYQLSSQVRYLTAGAVPPFDATWSAAAGGYPKNAVISKSSGNGWWINLADGNNSNPDLVGTNWLDYKSYFYANAALTGASTAATASVGDNSTLIATTAFLQNNAVGGKGYTYSDVTASRALNTTFTNSTNRPIFVLVTMQSGVSNQTPEMITGSVVLQGTGQGGAGLGMTVSGIIQPGATYFARVSNGNAGTLNKWVELS